MSETVLEEVVPRHQPTLREEIEQFTVRLDGLETTLPLVILTAIGAHRYKSQKLGEFLESNAELTKEEENEKNYRVPLKHVPELNRLQREIDKVGVGLDIIPRSFLVSLVSQFDIFLGRLLRWLYETRPELLNASQKTIPFSELVGFSSIEAAREFIIEKEIETFLRESHIDQIAILEKLLSIPLRKGLDIWPTFVELCERRNLFVHSDGVVSRRYLQICADHGMEISDTLRPGARLEVSPSYYRESSRCLYEIGVKLAQTIWRKTLPSDLDSADASLIQSSYSLLRSRRYALAQRLLDYGCSLKKWGNDRNRRMLVINTAQCCHWSRQEEQCAAILDAEDWSACGVEFRLGVAVLRNEFKQAAQLVKEIGNDGFVKKEAYEEWPLFKEFRRTEEFRSSYKEVFGEDFVSVAEMPSRSRKPELAAILESVKQIFKEPALATRNPAENID